MADNPLIVALDVSSLEEAQKFTKLLRPLVSYYKVGMRLFTTCGPESVRMILDQGGKVFLDLKFHDIPNTVAQACESAVTLGVSMMNVHASGGREMLMAAAKAVDKKAKLIGVTVLTSTGGDVAGRVEELALLCKESGLDGVVCSAREASQVKGRCGPSFLVVTPGIRPSGSSIHDQKRIQSPKGAIEAGADYLVVGRPILEATDPLAVTREILSDLSLPK